MNKPCVHGEADGFFITEVCGPSARVLWKCHHRGSGIGLCVLVPDEEALRHSWLCAAANRTKTVGVAYLQGRQNP